MHPVLEFGFHSLSVVAVFGIVAGSFIDYTNHNSKGRLNLHVILVQAWPNLSGGKNLSVYVLHDMLAACMFFLDIKDGWILSVLNPIIDTRV